MIQRRFGERVLAIVGLLTFGAVAAGADVVDDTVRNLERSAGADIKVSKSADTGLVSFLSVTAGHAVPVTGARSTGAADRAAAFLDQSGSAFGLSGSSEVRMRRVSKIDDVGIEHVRFQQLHNGVPVRGAELAVHLKGSSVVAANATTLAGLDGVATTPGITEAAAIAAARTLVRDQLHKPDASLSTAKLEIVNPGLLLGRAGTSSLAWFIEARGTALREFIWVDANDGKILFHFSQLTHGKDRMIYNSNSTGTLPGTLVRTEGGPAVGDVDADAAYDYSGVAYDYFFTEHGRDSYDDLGSTLISSVHFCEDGICPLENAYWDGTQMVYGEGYANADDVDVHELSHAVTEYSADLVYCAQSGALNESFSDIFGETADLTDGLGNDVSGVRWQIGEDLAGIGPFRDMSDPNSFGNPAKVSDRLYGCYATCTDANDSGAVHGNSGVPNRAYVLMADGGTFNSYTVAGIGLTKAAKIQYRALTVYLLSTATFISDYNALNQACTDLIGTSGILAGDCAEVDNALKAVEMDQPVCPPPAACVATVAKPKTQIKGILKPSGARSLTFSGEVVLPHPFSPALDPATNGVRVYIEDSMGNVVADDTVTDYPYNKDAQLGWKVGSKGDKWTWVDKNGYISTVTKLSIQDKSAKTPGLVKFKVSGKAGDYQVSNNLPVTATLVIDPPAAGGSGQCGSTSFNVSGQMCELSATGDALKCK